MKSPVVPHHYQGVWRRAFLTTPNLCDDRTLVLWMQTARWHADLRVPVDRADCSRCSSLADCNRSQLLSLLKQEGFAGVTVVDGANCEWQRQMDYHPTGRPDCASMRFSHCCNTLDEYGIAEEYAERWERELDSELSGLIARSNFAEGRVLWLRSGKCFMMVRPRLMDVMETRAIWERTAAGQAVLEELRRLADFEISYGLIEADHGCILHSTLPWREWQKIALPEVWTTD